MSTTSGRGAVAQLAYRLTLLGPCHLRGGFARQVTSPLAPPPPAPDRAAACPCTPGAGRLSTGVRLLTT